MNLVHGDVMLRDRAAEDLQDYLRWLGLNEWQEWDAPWEKREEVDEASMPPCVAAGRST